MSTLAARLASVLRLLRELVATRTPADRRQRRNRVWQAYARLLATARASLSGSKRRSAHRGLSRRRTAAAQQSHDTSRVVGAVARLERFLAPRARGEGATEQALGSAHDAEAESNFQRWLASQRAWQPGERPRREQGRAAQPGSGHGGQAVLKRYGERFFSAIGARGGQSVVHERGTEYLQQIGAKGGAATRRRYGREHYAAIGRKGGQAGRGQKRPRKRPGQAALPLPQAD